MIYDFRTAADSITVAASHETRNSQLLQEVEWTQPHGSRDNVIGPPYSRPRIGRWILTG